MMALNVELKTNDGSKGQNWQYDSEHQNWEYGSKRQAENATLNVERKEYMMTLNFELETNNGSECQNEDAALNVEPKMQLWMSN